MIHSGAATAPIGETQKGGLACEEAGASAADVPWSQKTVLVTGATGFLGFHVATRLVREGASVRALVRSFSKASRLIQGGVTCIQGELSDRSTLLRACQGCEYLFHLAGVVNSGADWDLFRRVNVEGTRGVLEAARSTGVRRIVYTSSIVAVGARRRPEVLDERAHWNLGHLSVPYVNTKREAEELVLSAAGGSVDVVVVNPGIVVGPDDFFKSAFGTLCYRFWHGRVPFYFDGGGCFVDVRDVARGHLLAARQGRSGARYILGGENMTYGKFFQALARAGGMRIFRLRLPLAVAPVVGWLNDRLMAHRSGRSYLTSTEVPLLSLYFYSDSVRARQELGYHSRPIQTSLADAYRFWCGKDGKGRFSWPC